MGCIVSKFQSPQVSVVTLSNGRYTVQHVLQHNYRKTLMRALDTHQGNSKVILKRFADNASSEGVHELETLSTLQHANIITVLSAFYNDSNDLYLVLPDVGCDMFDFINKHNGLSEKVLMRILAQLLDALIYMKNVHQLAHCDISPENVTINENTLKVKLIDFGDATHSGKDEIQVHKRRHGKYAYMPPEVYKRREENLYSSDMWSLGVFTVAAFTCLTCYEYPDSGDDVLFTNFIRAVERGFNPPLSDELKNLVQAMLNMEFTKRITCERARRHSWFLKELVDYPLVDST